MLINKLSYENHSQVNLSTELRKALKKIGVHEQKIMQFDAHSAIEIALENNLTINIEVANDRVWLCSRLRVVQNNLHSNAISVLEILAKPVRHLETEHIVIEFHQDDLLAKAIVNIESIENECLAEVLSDYYKVLLSLSEMV